MKQDATDTKVHWNMENPNICAYRSAGKILRKTGHIKASHRRYTRLWHVCILMMKLLKDIMEKSCN